jgi:hypothetical protein
MNMTSLPHVRDYMQGAKRWPGLLPKQPTASATRNKFSFAMRRLVGAHVSRTVARGELSACFWPPTITVRGVLVVLHVADQGAGTGSKLSYRTST